MITIIGDITLISLTNTTEVTVFNTINLLEVFMHNSAWHKSKKGYAIAWSKIIKQPIHLHQIIKPLSLTDHKNRNKLNNLDSNLRSATIGMNSVNVIRKSKHGFRGLHLQSSGKWQTGIKVNGKRIYIGQFESKEAAARAYDQSALAYHGEFAVLNFPKLSEPVNLSSPSQPSV